MKAEESRDKKLPCSLQCVVLLVCCVVLLTSHCFASSTKMRIGNASSSATSPEETLLPCPTLCLLPIGDSLTQGVGSYGSYRPHLASLIESKHPHLSPNNCGDVRAAAGGARGGVQYFGSQRRTCTPKRPLLPYVGDVYTMPHEGHCSWNSRLLLEHLRRSLPRPPSTAAVVPLPFTGRFSSGYEHLRKMCEHGVVDASLLLIGHNDGFQAARHCRLREGAGYRDRDKASTQCVAKFLSEFESNLAAIVTLLLDTFSEPSSSSARNRSRVIIGLNPTTHFGVVDVVLHEAIHTVVAEYGRGRTTTVSFDGWSAEHTFDSTHPNERGTLLMAQRWYDGIVAAGVEHLYPQNSDQRRDQEEQALMKARLESVTVRGHAAKGETFAGRALNDEDVGDSVQDIPFGSTFWVHVTATRFVSGALLVTVVVAASVRRLRTSIRGLFRAALNRRGRGGVSCC